MNYFKNFIIKAKHHSNCGHIYLKSHATIFIQPRSWRGQTIVAKRHCD